MSLIKSLLCVRESEIEVDLPMHSMVPLVLLRPGGQVT